MARETDQPQGPAAARAEARRRRLQLSSSIAASLGALKHISPRSKSRGGKLDSTMLQIEEELKLQQVDSQRQLRAISSVPASDWQDFAELPDAESRQQWLLSLGLYSAAFGADSGSLPGTAEIQLLDELICSEHFGGLQLSPERSVRQSKALREIEREIVRRQRSEDAEERRRRDAVERNTKRFWQDLSGAERREYGKLSTDGERQRWVSKQGGATLFGFSPSAALALLSELSRERARAEPRSASAPRLSSQ